MPPNGEAGTYISAHTIVNNAGIYTAPGDDPAYVSINGPIPLTTAQAFPVNDGQN